MESNLIITLSGKAHVGKDLVGELFKRYCEEMGMTGFTLAFADSLKNHMTRIKTEKYYKILGQE